MKRPFPFAYRLSYATFSPQVELGAYQVQIGTPASLSADFTVHS